jgi:hypothetical protein
MLCAAEGREFEGTLRDDIDIALGAFEGEPWPSKPARGEQGGKDGVAACVRRSTGFPVRQDFDAHELLEWLWSASLA